MNRLIRLARHLPLQTALLLAPIAWCAHQIEESSGGFRVWRGRHFPANNALPGPHVFAILTALGLLSILWFTVRRSKPTAAFALLFFLTTQLHNVVYHVGAGVYVADYSPGTVTAVILYLPINLFLLWQAIREQWVTAMGAGALLLVSGGLYWAFELIGPVVIALGFGVGVTAVAVAERRSSRST
ncbi:MAG: HXXEE domain-containing protein [Gemmatimonadota bacterium]|nr:HXXEE domain-containing protein [Gemmatimonadota bacterium]